MKCLLCPRGHKRMELRKLKKETRFRGVTITYEAEVFVCPECGLEAGTISSAGAVQRAIADGYRKAAGLLSGEEIRLLRQSRNLSPEGLAKQLRVAAADIAGWESGRIQPAMMDRKLRVVLIMN